MTKYSVIYTDQGDTCDGLARTLGTYNSKEEAIKEMQADVKFYRKANDMYEITEQDDKHMFVGDEDGGCLWQIVELEV